MELSELLDISSSLSDPMLFVIIGITLDPLTFLIISGHAFPGRIMEGSTQESNVLLFLLSKVIEHCVYFKVFTCLDTVHPHYTYSKLLVCDEISRRIISFDVI